MKIFRVSLPVVLAAVCILPALLPAQELFLTDPALTPCPASVGGIYVQGSKVSGTICYSSANVGALPGQVLGIMPPTPLPEQIGGVRVQGSEVSDTNIDSTNNANVSALARGALAIGWHASPPETNLAAFIAQRDRQPARIAALRREIASLEAELIDPRIALTDSIQAITHAEEELVRVSLTGPVDTELLRNVAPFVSTLASMRDAHLRQLAALGMSAPADPDRIGRLLRGKRDELRVAEALLATLETQIESLRSDRDLTRRTQDLNDLNIVSPVPGIPALRPSEGSVSGPKPAVVRP